MTHHLKALFGLILSLALIAPAMAEDEDWDVQNPPGDKRDISIDTDEGTWMSLDVSPDGETIAFDFLGDIYTLPMEGGTATSIASGMAWDIQPRFSPDGSQLAFTSDRSGGDNIWVMDADGDNKRAVTDESFRLLNNPTWSPDGRFIAARKHFTTSRSLGTGEIWLYHTSGGSGVKLVERPSESHQKELGEPMFSPDGQSIYYSANTTGGSTFIYAQDSNTQLFEIMRYDMDSGETESFVSGPGGAVRPAPSPDGRYMAFVRRIRAQSALFLMDMSSGESFPIYTDLDQDMQETWAVHGVYPNMDWTPNSDAIVFWSGGKIRKYDMASGQTSVIPFRVNDTREIIDPPRPQIEVSPDSFDANMIRFASPSPDGRQVVYEALGRLYIRALPNGQPRLLTQNSGDEFEVFPAWSRDGQSITYVAWNDERLGTIRVISPNGGAARDVTYEPGHYRRPAFSPSGDSIVFERGSGGYLTDGRWSANTGLYRVPSVGGAPVKITGGGSWPHFGARADRVYFTARRDGSGALVSTDMNGYDERVHASSELAYEYHVAPNGGHIAVQEDYNIYVMPLLGGPQNVSSGPGSSAVPVVQASRNGALYPVWSGDGQTVYWSLGSTLQKVDVDNLIAAAPRKDKDYDPRPEGGTDLSMSFDADRPGGVIALTGARIITMSDENGGIIENGVIVVNAGRITAIGEMGNVSIPSDAEVLNVSGKTIIPGLIDAHAHGAQASDDIIPQQNWAQHAHLALGVTTVHDPSSTASEIFAASQMQRAGIIVGPRVFSTGEIIYGARAPGYHAVINSLDDARGHVRRLKAQGANSVKNYNQPRREQRQQVVTAAREENIAVVAEGGSLFHMDLSMVADGNTSIEHNLPQAMLYEDVLQFYSQTQVAYIPTLVVTYGGRSGENYWYQEDDVWLHPILSDFVPPHILQPRSVRRVMAPEEDYVDDVSAATAKQLADRGVLVGIGAHGQREGLASHWEMWSFARGGMSPLEALRTATTAPAEHLGYDRDIGSLEIGKLADLVILDADPLQDIRNSDQIDKVMLGGRLYEAETLNETLTGDYIRQPYYWQ